MTVDSLTTAPTLPADALRKVEWPGTTSALSRLRASRWTVFALLAALMLVSAVLRVRQLSFYYWVDEGISVGISSHHLTQLPSLLREDGSPPLYYVLLHVWMQIWGRSETATHALSLIFALAAIPVAYWAGSSVFDRRTGATARSSSPGCRSSPAMRRKRGCTHWSCWSQWWWRRRSCTPSSSDAVASCPRSSRR